jgi:hypothetical protein
MTSLSDRFLKDWPSTERNRRAIDPPTNQQPAARAAEQMT